MKCLSLQNDWECGHNDDGDNGIKGDGDPENKLCRLSAHPTTAAINLPPWAGWQHLRLAVEDGGDASVDGVGLGWLGWRIWQRAKWRSWTGSLQMQPDQAAKAQKSIIRLDLSS